MPGTPVLLRHDHFAGRAATRIERVLAVGRIFLAGTGLLAAYFDPSEIGHVRDLTYAVLLGYVAYSLAILIYLRSTSRVASAQAWWLHGVDILWAAALVLVSQGPISPYFLFFFFAVISAAYRWGLRETVWTAVVIVTVLVTEVAVESFSSSRWFTPGNPELDREIVGVAYLLLAGVLLGHLAEQDKLARAELAAIADATRQPHVHLGLGGSVTAVARGLLATFRADAVAVVVRDNEVGLTHLWEVTHAADGESSHRRRLTTETEQETWLFPDPGRTWHATGERSAAGATEARVTEPDLWPLGRDQVTLPEAFVSARRFRTVTVVNMGLIGEWQARAYLFDISRRSSLERSLHFLEALAEHVTPGFTNLFLLRRLRERAGAAERAHVARELHDGTIQSLVGIEMRVAAIRRESHQTVDQIRADLGEIQGLLRGEVLDLRELMQALRPVELDSSEQLADVLAKLVERFRSDTGIAARFIASGDRISLPPGKAIEIVRITQEALVNVRKHSRARNVLVRLTGANGTSSLLVEDDGLGFAFEGRLSADELDALRIGPAIIKERARLAGARLAIDSKPGSGTRLEIVLTEGMHV